MKQLTPITDPENLGRTRRDYTGQRFGALVALGEAGRDGKSQIYWEFRCDCGNIRVDQVSSVAPHKRASCGCLYRQPLGVSAGRQRYRVYASTAKKSGRVFALSFEDFYALSQQPCHYCGALPSRQHAPLSVKGRPNYHGEFVYNGIDRLDNTVGYVVENCVPCCWDCNHAKGAKTYAEFVAWLDGIAAFRRRP